MGRKAEATLAGAVGDGVKLTVASTTQRNHPSVSSTPDVLISLAEELGRLLARRLLTDSGRRCGYGLPELLIGAAVTAFVLLLIARTLGWLAH